MMGRWILPIATATLALAVGFGVGRWSADNKTAPMTPKMHEYCSTVSVALEMDARDFEHGSDVQKLEAVRRFGEQVTFHSPHEISLCARKPVDLEKHDLCVIGSNYECLAKLARAASEATKP